MQLKSLLRAAAAVVLGASALTAHAADKVRIGYWSSGVSLGYGSVLEATDFLKNQGLDVEFVRFPDVNAPLRALASNSIDLAFGAPAAGGSVAVIAGAVLAGNHKIGANDFSLVGGNESRLAQFLAQKQVDGAALRSVTVAQLKELNVTRLGSFAQEWQRLTGSQSVPYIGIGAVRAEFVQAHPDTVARVIAGLRNTLAWGDTHRDQVVEILQKSANLPAEDARIYAAQWNDMNRVAFEAADLATLKRQHEVFAAGGLIKGELPADLFVTGPYEAAKKLK